MSLTDDLIDRCQNFIKEKLRNRGVLLNPYLEVDRLRAELRNGNGSVECNLAMCKKRIESLKKELEIEELIESYLVSLIEKVSSSGKISDNNRNIQGKFPSANKNSNALTNKIQFDKICKQFSNSDTRSPSKIPLGKSVDYTNKSAFRRSDELKELHCQKKNFDTPRNIYQYSSLRLSGQKDGMKVVPSEDVTWDYLEKCADGLVENIKDIETNLSGHEFAGKPKLNLTNIETINSFTFGECISSSEPHRGDERTEDSDTNSVNMEEKNTLDTVEDNNSGEDGDSHDTFSEVSFRRNKCLKRGKNCNLSIRKESAEDDDGQDSDEDQILLIRQSFCHSRLFCNFTRFSTKEMLEKKAERLSKRFSSTDVSRSSQEVLKMESLPEMSPSVLDSCDELDSTPVTDNNSVLDLSLEPPFINSSPLPHESSNNKPDLRQILLGCLSRSEQEYVAILDSILKCKEELIKGQVIPTQDLQIIFYKIPELHKIHTDFLHFLDTKISPLGPGEDQLVGKAFKILAIEEFSIAPDFLKNYPTAVSTILNFSNTNIPFNNFVKKMDEPRTDKNALEDKLLQPIVQFQKSACLLNDLIKYTPVPHPDYDLLQKSLLFAKNFLDQIDTLPSNQFDQQRYLTKHGLVVEKVNKNRKLQHIFLFNDLIIGAKQKPSNKSVNPFEVKWFIPLIEVSLEDRPKVEEDKLLEREQKEEIGSCRKRMKELQNNHRVELNKLKEQAEKSKIKLRNPKLTNKSLEKIAKKIKDQEAALVISLPYLPFKIFHKKLQKQHFLLMSSDYERYMWRETIIGLMGKTEPVASFTVNEAQQLLNNPKMIRATGANIDREDLEGEDYLYGSMRLQICQLHGLQKPLNVFCDVEVDSFGHFERKARTSDITGTTEPLWDEVFDIDLEGTQTLRLLCYCKGEGNTSDSLLGKGTLELRRIWLDDGEKEYSLPLSNEIYIKVTLSYFSNNQMQDLLADEALLGTAFEDISRNETSSIPYLVRCCTKIVEEGIKEEGIYRISGNLSLVQNLQGLFRTDPQQAEAKARSSEVHTVTSLIKLFFRSLPNPLFSVELYSSFVAALALKDPDACSKCILHIFKKLPKPNLATAEHMISHLIRVSKEEEKNKMGIRNLAVVFGPTFFRPPARRLDLSSTDQLFLLSAYETVNQVRLLQQILAIFSTSQHEGTRISDSQ